MGERGLQIRSGLSKQGWENADFPILCENCMGESPYIRMMKSHFNRECKICSRPFTVFRWRPGPAARFKKTEVCQTCAKMKNVCQTCLLDLEYGLPVEVRDKFMDQKEKIEVPKNAINRQFWAQHMNKNIGDLQLPYENMPVDTEILDKLSRSKPYYDRNQPHICSFYLKGECERGAECPYRHTIPKPASESKGAPDLSKQDLKSRFHGHNDPVAAKILQNVNEFKPPPPPTDKKVSTLFLGGINEKISEKDIEKAFCSYGAIKSIRIHIRQNCGFCTFNRREEADLAMSSLHNKLSINGIRIKLMWAKTPDPPLAQHKKGNEGVGAVGPIIPPPVGPPPITKELLVTPAVGYGGHGHRVVPLNLRRDEGVRGVGEVLGGGGNPFALGPTFYPSMDPDALGGLKSQYRKWAA